MSRLFLALLGPIQITLDDEPVARITSPRIVALLAYLGVEQDRAHSREALAELLWPGQPTGRQNLRQALSRLRKALPQPAGEPPFLLATRRDIRFNPAADQQVDVALFISELNRARAHDHPSLGQCPACIQQLEQAVDRRRGDFLAGLAIDSPAFEEWIREQATGVDAAGDPVGPGRAGQPGSGRRKHPRALAFAQRQLDLDPLREEAHCQRRYGLHESLRHFAGEQMARFPSAQAETRRRHAIHYLDLMASQEARLLGHQANDAQTAIRPELDNVRVAWTWAVSQADAGLMGRGLTALYRYFNAAGLVHEGLQAMDDALDTVQPGDQSPGARLVRARLLTKKARFLNVQGQYGQAADAARSATESLAQPAAPQLPTEPTDQTKQPRAIAAEAWLQRGWASLYQGRYDEAAGHLEEALGEAWAAGDAQVEAEVHLNLGTIGNFRNEFSLATAHHTEALRLARLCSDRYSERPQQPGRGGRIPG